MRKMMDKIDPLLIDIAVVEGIRRTQWKTAMGHISKAFKIAQKHGEYTDAELVQFQLKVDQFYTPWLSLHGSNASSNYIHYISSGHLTRYMYKYRSLWKYSQQSWEALNNLVKTFYFRRTQRGGVCGYKGSGGKSKLKSIGRWLQRRTLFLCGFTNTELLQLYDQILADSDKESEIDDSSETWSVSDDLLLRNSDRLLSHPEEIEVYTNDMGEVISQLV